MSPHQRVLTAAALTATSRRTRSARAAAGSGLVVCCHRRGLRPRRPAARSSLATRFLACRWPRRRNRVSCTKQAVAGLRISTPSRAQPPVLPAQADSSWRSVLVSPPSPRVPASRSA